MSRAATRLLVLSLLVVLAAAGAASAYLGGGSAGSDFDGRIVSVHPAMPGVTVRIGSFGNDLEIANASSTEVAVPGYFDEPYLRIGPSGVWRNVRSPATYIDADLFGRVQLPAAADPQAAPQWVRISAEPRYVWHDHRTHWMSANLLPPRVAADPTRSHLVFDWTVALRYGNTPVIVTGALTWSPPPSPWLVWPVGVALAAVAVLAGAVARSPRPLAALMTVGAVAAVWHALATPEPPALAALIAVLLAALALRSALRGRGAPTGLLAVVLGGLLLIVGLPDVEVLWTAHLLARGPQPATRLAVIALVTLGPGLVLGGLAAARRLRAAGAVPRGDEAGRPAPVG